MSPQLRTDVLTGRQVIVASGRAGRPNARTGEPELHVDDDPFLEGHESETPGERFAFRTPGTSVNEPGWHVRVVPNRYPLTDEAGRSAAIAAGADDALFPMKSVSGAHDVVIECPDLRTRLSDLDPVSVDYLLQAWRQRIRDLSCDARIAEVIVFRNEGFSAGASLPHCHSQIVGWGTTSPGMSARRRQSLRYFRETGRDLTQDWLEAELKFGERIVHRDRAFTVVCPFAPRTSFHMRIVPCGPAARVTGFGETGEDELQEVGRLLTRCVSALEMVVGSVSWNLLLPTGLPDRPADFQWMIDIVPRMSRPAGWELLTDVDVVTTAPEAAASSIRAAM